MEVQNKPHYAIDSDLADLLLSPSRLPSRVEWPVAVVDRT